MNTGFKKISLSNKLNYQKMTNMVFMVKMIKMRLKRLNSLLLMVFLQTDLITKNTHQFNSSIINHIWTVMRLKAKKNFTKIFLVNLIRIKMEKFKDKNFKT